MKIHGDLISPFARMCLVTAHEAGIGDKVELVAAKVLPIEANRELAALSPIAKIPVLVTDHGHPIHDSRVIIEYLCHVSGNKTLIPDDGVKRFRVLTLQAIGQGIGDAAVSYRYETAQRPGALQWQAFMDRLKLRVDTALNELDHAWEKDLSEVTAGSIAAAVVLSYLDYRLGAWAWRNGRPKLAGFHERFSARPSMQKTALPAA
jgi:glutathione S-transferase